MNASASRPEPSIDVVIVACNSGPILEDCVARVLLGSGCVSLTLIDNASHDEWPQRVSKRFATDSRFTLMRNERNLGFGAACNLAAKVGQSPLILLLNPDCLVDHDSLPALAEILRNDDGIGLLGADVRDGVGREEAAARRRAPTPLRLLHDQMPTLLSRFDGVALSRSSELVQRVDACSGALMLLRRRSFDSLSGFDEAYFLHGEDLDLCARVRAQGLDVAVANEVRVTHRQGSSSHARPIFVAFHKHLGMTRYLLRHASRNVVQSVLIALGMSLLWLLRGLPKSILTRAP